jgi:hypothetical protein
MPVDPRIEVEGLKAFQKAIRELGDRDIKKQLRESDKAAAQVVVDEALPTVPVGATGKAAASLKAVGLSSGAAVRGGGSTAPYFGFLDYGNKVHSGAGVGRGDSQVRPYEKGGRIVYPALNRSRATVLERYEHGIDQVIKAAGFD